MLQQPFRCRVVCACVKLRQQRGAPPPRPTLSSHRRLHHSPPKPSPSSRPFSEAFNSKAASPRRRRLRHQHPLPALHDTHCSHAPHIAPGMRRHPRPRMLLLLVEQALPATAVAREPQAAHCSAWCCRRRCCTACSPCLWPSETRAFCRRRRQGRESSGWGKKKRGEGQGLWRCAAAGADGVRVLARAIECILQILKQHVRLHNNNPPLPPFGACAIGGGGVDGSHGRAPTSDY